MTTKDRKVLKVSGKKLKQLRKERGFSIRKFADGADIANSALTKPEAGKMNPSLLMLLKLSAALRIELIGLVAV